MTQKTYKVSGMSCNHCVMHVKNAVEELDGVKKCNVDLKSESMQVSFDEGKVNFGDLKVAVEDAGYELRED
jgi:copper chaperone